MTKYLHTMVRVSSLEDSLAFFGLLGLREIRRRDDEKGRYTNVFLAAPGDEAAPGAPSSGEAVCPVCNGTGQRDDGSPCPMCEGSGKIIQGIGGG